MKQLSQDFMNGVIYMAQIAAKIARRNPNAEPKKIADWIMDASGVIYDRYETQIINEYEDIIELEYESLLSESVPVETKKE